MNYTQIMKRRRGHNFAIYTDKPTHFNQFSYHYHATYLVQLLAKSISKRLRSDQKYIFKIPILEVAYQDFHFSGGEKGHNFFIYKDKFTILGHFVATVILYIWSNSQPNPSVNAGDMIKKSFPYPKSR